MAEAEPSGLPDFHTVCSFVVLATAAASISEVLRKTFKLPLITGYILTGILCGPHVLALVSDGQTKSLARVINDDAMGFIGFSAGSKFLLSELQGNLRQILSLLFGLVVTTYCLVLLGLMLASPWLALTAGRPQAEAIAIALIIACLAVARSPSSAIALVSELNAYGTFTTAALSVTVLMDVVVVLLFALTLLMVHAVAPEPGKESAPVGEVLGLFGIQLIVSGIIGVALGHGMHAFISCTSSGVARAALGATGKPAEPAQSSMAEAAKAPKQPTRKSAVSFADDAGGAGDAEGAKAAAAPSPSKRAPPKLRRWGTVIGASAHVDPASAAAAVADASAKAAGGAAELLLDHSSQARRTRTLTLALALDLSLTRSVCPPTRLRHGARRRLPSCGWRRSSRSWWASRSPCS